MDEWLRISLILCVYGVLKEIRPLEPFITKFLASPPMNFTMEEINVDIYPVSVYANMVLLVIVFLVTDYIRYKPIIIVNSLAGVSLYLMLIISRSVFALQVVEALYGLFTACEVAYYTYIYAKVDREHYQEVTGHTRAAYLLGRCVSGLLSQLLYSVGVKLMYLCYITTGVLALSLIWAVSLPPVGSSMYFHRAPLPDANSNSGPNSTLPSSKWNKVLKGFGFLWKDFKSAVNNLYVLKWMCWWALAACGYMQVLQFVQVLWQQILEEDPQSGGDYNGAVEAAYTILSALAAVGCGKISIDWKKYGELALFVCSSAIGLILISSSHTTSMMIAYLTYVSYAVIYNAMITIANSEVAKHVNQDSYGLIFGFVTFAALCLQSLVTLIFVQELKLPARQQFLIYGGYFLSMGVFFGLKFTFSRVMSCFSKAPTRLDTDL